MKSTRLYLCQSGDITDTIRACGFGDARIKFFQKHGVQREFWTEQGPCFDEIEPPMYQIDLNQ